MDPFIAYNPTQLIFGRGRLAELKEQRWMYGKRGLLVYGEGSIKRNGIYDRTFRYLKEMGTEIFELSGVEPNPRLSTVYGGVKICKQERIDFLLAVGGGSVIDATKAIAVGAKMDGDVWDVITKKVVPTEALPFGTVLTLAATGSEMNSGSVITHWETKEKVGWGSPLVFPKFSILDPIHTVTVPKEQTIYGMVDIMSHCLEHYLSPSPHVPLNERMTEAVLMTVMETAPQLLADLQNDEHRETILFCGTMALNGVLSQGMFGDWATHAIEHAVSAVYDIPHGGGLAILFPNRIRYHLKEMTSKMKKLAIRVFHIDPTGKTDAQIAEEGVEALRQFWSELGAPCRLADYGIDATRLEEIAEKAVKPGNGSIGRFKKLHKEDVYTILEMSL